MYVEWNPERYIFETAIYKLSWYEVCFAAMFVIGFFLNRREFKKYGVPEDQIFELWIVTIITEVFAIHITHGLFYDWERYSAEPFRFLDVTRGGFASHGTVAGLMIPLWIWAKIRGYNTADIWDRFVPAAVIGTIFIRLGNLSVGEIYGRVTNVPWAFRFVGREGPHAMPRHPSQIYEIIIGVLMLVLTYFLYWKFKRRHPRYLILGAFLASYFVLRFIVEFFKEYQTLDSYSSALTMGQYLSIPCFGVGAILLVLAFRNWKKGNLSPESIAKS